MRRCYRGRPGIMVPMGLPAKLLGDGEQELLHLRSHGKVMIKPTIWLIVVAALGGVVFAMLPVSWRPASAWVVPIIWRSTSSRGLACRWILWWMAA